MSRSLRTLAAAVVLVGLWPAPLPGQTPPEFKLVPGGITAGEELGAASAVVGDLAVFGAPHASGGGAVYLYRQVAGLWTEEQQLLGSGRKSLDRFGDSVATDGTRILVGAPWHDSATTDAGAVYVFSHNGSFWVEDQKLTASDAASSDLFGSSVALVGSRLIAGAPFSDGAGRDAGAAYVFDDSGGTGWIEAQKLDASDASAGSRFGGACAMTGTLLLIGAHLDDEAGSNAGAVYAFDDSLTGFQEAQKLMPAGINSWLGQAIAIQGSRAVLGASTDSASKQGSAYVMAHDGSQWTQEANLLTIIPTQGQVGRSVALDQDTVLLGAPSATVRAGFAGVVLVFRKDGADWYETMRIAAADSSGSDHLGSSVALSSGTALMGAEQRDEGGLSNCGAIYGQTTSFTLTATPSAPVPGDTMTLSAFSGRSGTPLMIAVIQVDGIPLFQKLVFTTFTIRHRFDLPATVPSGLSGIRLDMQAYKFGVPGGAEASSVATVDFQ